MPRFEVRMIVDVPETSALLGDPAVFREGSAAQHTLQVRLRQMMYCGTLETDKISIHDFEVTQRRDRYMVVQTNDMTDQERAEFAREYPNAKFVPYHDPEHFERPDRSTDIDVAGAIELATMGNLNGAIRVLAGEMTRADAAGFELTRSSATFRHPADEG